MGLILFKSLESVVVLLERCHSIHKWDYVRVESFSIAPHYWAETTNLVLFQDNEMIVKFVQSFLVKALHSLFSNCFPSAL